MTEDTPPSLNGILRTHGFTLRERAAIHTEHQQHPDMDWELTPTAIAT